MKRITFEEVKRILFDSVCFIIEQKYVEMTVCNNVIEFSAEEAGLHYSYKIDEFADFILTDGEHVEIKVLTETGDKFTIKPLKFVKNCKPKYYEVYIKGKETGILVNASDKMEALNHVKSLIMKDALKIKPNLNEIELKTK